MLMSHLHSDHAGRMDVFPDAEFVLRQEELRYCWWPDPVQEVFYLDGDFAMLRSERYDITVVDGEYDVFGDGSVVAFPTPGHTPGHQSVHVDRGSREVILGIDIAHQQDGLDREHAASFDPDLSTALESMRAVKSRARAADANLYVTHDNDHIEAFEGGARSPSTNRPVASHRSAASTPRPSPRYPKWRGRDRSVRPVRGRTSRRPDRGRDRRAAAAGAGRPTSSRRVRAVPGHHGPLGTGSRCQPPIRRHHYRRRLGLSAPLPVRARLPSTVTRRRVRVNPWELPARLVTARPRAGRARRGSLSSSCRPGPRRCRWPRWPDG